MNKWCYKYLPIADVLLKPFVYASAWLLKRIRCLGIQRLPMCKDALLDVGVFPIRNHYYEPQFDYRSTELNSLKDRNLRGIDWNVSGQLEMLDRFIFSQEFEGVPQEKTDSLQFYFNNSTFLSGDAEYWYQIIRTVKPKRIVEVGSGNSTLLAISAIKRNKEECSSYECEHICIEPYENPWLEETGVTVIRKKVEEIKTSFFSCLQEHDVLFIDSSHIIRPQGDVLFEYLELLPTLNKGVIVHLHDIFSPKNYLQEWLENHMLFWNEQYLLEAFLSHNSSWTIIGALNFLHHNHYEKLHSVAPLLRRDREPGSFYIQRTA
ncbi:MAG: class I SAM-dependent methyltransferase [Candidatus Electrothrix sp. AR1]|nr:class I SAM-dependent methyltransferase [Candidatus Electrothrix sp. AR1]